MNILRGMRWTNFALLVAVLTAVGVFVPVQHLWLVPLVGYGMWYAYGTAHSDATEAQKRNIILHMVNTSPDKLLRMRGDLRKAMIRDGHELRSEAEIANGDKAEAAVHEIMATIADKLKEATGREVQVVNAEDGSTTADTRKNDKEQA